MDCTETESGWFEFKGFMDGSWEQDVSQAASCTGDVGGRGM